MKRALGVLSGIAAAGALGIAASASQGGVSTSDRDRAMTIRLTAVQGPFTYVDNPPLAAKPEDLEQGDVSPGDMVVSSSTLSSRGRRVGRLHAVCTVTLVRRQGILGQCISTLTLKQGQITAQRAILPPRGEERETFTLAVTGGTGRYGTARGTIASRELPGRGGPRRDALTIRLAK